MPGVAPLPSGTVTFLFLDIEGSTGLLERIGADYRTPQIYRDNRGVVIRRADPYSAAKATAVRCFRRGR